MLIFYKLLQQILTNIQPCPINPSTHFGKILLEHLMNFLVFTLHTIKRRIILTYHDLIITYTMFIIFIFSF